MLSAGFWAAKKGRANSRRQSIVGPATNRQRVPTGRLRAAELASASDRRVGLRGGHVGDAKRLWRWVPARRIRQYTCRGAPSHARKNSRNEDFVLVVVVATVSAFYLAVGFRHKLPTTTANYAVSYQSQGYRAQPHQR